MWGLGKFLFRIIVGMAMATMCQGLVYLISITQTRLYNTNIKQINAAFYFCELMSISMVLLYQVQCLRVRGKHGQTEQQKAEFRLRAIPAMNVKTGVPVHEQFNPADVLHVESMEVIQGAEGLSDVLE